MSKSIFKAGVMACTIALSLASCSDDEAPNPVAGFTYTIDKPTMEVTFTNTSTDAVGYSWNFGDATPVSTEANPKHKYAQEGKYDVVLTAVGDVGTVPAEKKESITIEDPGGPNLLTGGNFEKADEASWTILHSGQKDKDGNLVNVKYEFGYTAYKPTLGNGGSLYIYPNNSAAIAQHEEGTIIYKEIGQLAAGKYKISAMVKLMGENKDNPTSAMANYWFEFLVRTEKPVEADGYNFDRVSGWYYGGWTGWQVIIPRTDGPLVHTYIAANKADKDGVFTLDAAGKYYMVIKVGKGWYSDGNTFGEGIAVDNLKIQKVQ